MSTADDLDRLAALLRQHNKITDEIASLIRRPAERGHVGEWIASKVFGIRLADAATERGFDGVFAGGSLEGRRVNVRWYGFREDMLDLDPSGRAEFYLVMTGAKRAAVSSRDTSRPWVITAVFLFDFDAARLHEALRTGGKTLPKPGDENKTRSVAGEFWEAAEIHPTARSPLLVLTPEQHDLLGLFLQRWSDVMTAEPSGHPITLDWSGPYPLLDDVADPGPPRGRDPRASTSESPA